MRDYFLVSCSESSREPLQAQLAEYSDSIKELDSTVFLVRSVEPLLDLSREGRLPYAQDIVPVTEQGTAQSPVRSVDAFLEQLQQQPDASVLDKSDHIIVQVRGDGADADELARRWGVSLQNGEQVIKGRGAVARLIAERLNKKLIRASEAVADTAVITMFLVRGGHGQHWLGLHACKDLLSAWAGGEVRLKDQPGSLSRAEHKLEEAQLVLGFAPKAKGTVVDLGAAPGGWSRLLLEQGHHVVAVDPAALSPELDRYGDLLTHLKQQATDAYEALQKRAPYAAIVSDMRMAPPLAARLTADIVPFLSRAAQVLMTLKFSEQEFADTDFVMKSIDQVRSRMNRVNVTMLACRQLWSNRHELTFLGSARG